MPDVVVLLLAGSATAMATGLGAVPVFLFGERAERLTPFLLGFAFPRGGAAPPRRRCRLQGPQWPQRSHLGPRLPRPPLLPEGFAGGTAFASDRAGLSLFVIVAIAIQNIPEGTSVAIPMQQAGFGAGRQGPGWPSANSGRSRCCSGLGLPSE